MAERRRRLTLATIAGLMSGVVVVGVGELAPAAWREPVRERAFDLVLGLATPWRDWDAAPAVVIVAIDGPSLDALGPWPWRRETIARLIEAVNTAGPAAVAVDILLAGDDTRSPAALARSLAAETGRGEFETLAATLVDGDEVLAGAVSAGPVALGWVLDPRGRDAVATPPVFVRDGASVGVFWSADAATGPPAVLTEAAAGAGALSLPGDEDGVVRRVPLMVSLAGEPRPGIALEALRIATGASGYFIAGDPPSLTVGDLERRLPPGGLLRLIPAVDTVPRVSAATLIAGQAEASILTAAIVLIGGTAPELGALRPSSGDPLTPPAVLHATALRQFAAGIVPIRTASVAAVWERAAAVGAILAAVGLARRLRPLTALGGVVVLGAVIVGASVLLAAHDILVDATPALAAGAFGFVVAATGSYAESRLREAHLRRRFSQHLAPSVVDRIVATPDSVRLSGERREVTALFTDIEGFSTLTREIGAEALVKVLDGYFEGVAGLITAHGGMVDKFVGDAVHAIFNAPLDLPDHPARAVACAREILAWTEAHRMTGLAGRAGLGTTRIGIETGEAVVGDVGIGTKLDYTAHGDVVNIAARLEALNKELGTAILVGPGAAARCPEGTVRPLVEAELRGVGRMRVFTVT